MLSSESDVLHAMDDLLTPVAEDFSHYGVALSSDMISLLGSAAADIIVHGVRPRKPGRGFRRVVRLRSELTACIWHASHLFSSRWESMPEVAQRVIIVLMFDVGVPRFRKSKDFIVAMSLHDWHRAAAEVMRIVGADHAPEHFSRYARLLRSLSS